MEQFVAFFLNLFGVESWPARWVCGIWTPFHGWLYIISDTLIWLAYFVIPIYIVRYVRFKHKVELPKVFWLFAGFILLCGLTHLMDAIIFYWPAYRLSAFLRLITAIVSWATVIAIIKVFPSLLTMKTSDEYEIEIKQRERVEKQLKSSNEELERYAYTTSHDLQAPLKTMNSFLEIVSDEMSGKLTKDAEYALLQMQNGSRKMSVMIEGLLKYSRVGEDRKMEVLNLSNILNEVLDGLSADIKESGATINIDISINELKAVGLEMKQLFQNLISNAIKFQFEGNQPQINIKVESYHQMVKFTIADNGIGIEEEYLDKVFEVFQRLHKHSDYKGTGIGLATCKKIIDLYDGEIKVSSKTGQGTKFVFYINQKKG